MKRRIIAGCHRPQPFYAIQPKWARSAGQLQSRHQQAFLHDHAYQSGEGKSGPALLRSDVASEQSIGPPASCPERTYLEAAMPATANTQALVALLDDDDAGLSFQLRNEVSGLVACGLSIDEAAELVGIPAPDRLPVDPPFTPTPAMIWERCRAIQATWTATEWRSRRAVDPGKVETQIVRVADIGLYG